MILIGSIVWIYIGKNERKCIVENHLPITNEYILRRIDSKNKEIIRVKEKEIFISPGEKSSIKAPGDYSQVEKSNLVCPQCRFSLPLNAIDNLFIDWESYNSMVDNYKEIYEIPGSVIIKCRNCDYGFARRYASTSNKVYKSKLYTCVSCGNPFPARARYLRIKNQNNNNYDGTLKELRGDIIIICEKCEFEQTISQVRNDKNKYRVIKKRILGDWELWRDDILIGVVPAASKIKKLVEKYKQDILINGGNPECIIIAKQIGYKIFIEKE